MLIVRILKIIAVIIFCINTICLLIAILSPFYNPKYVWIPAMFGLFFKPFITIHLLYLLGFIISGKRRLFIFSFALFLFCMPQTMQAIGFAFRETSKSAPNDLKLMTYNVDFFSYTKEDIAVSDVLETIRMQDPTIICFQKYLINQKIHNKIESSLKVCGYKYIYEYTTQKLRTHTAIGQAVFSKIPFYNIQPIPFNNTSNGAFSVDIPIQNDTFRLFNVHFQSIALVDDEIKLPKSITEIESPNYEYYDTVLKKLRDAFRKRSYQALKVKEYTDISPYKVILCGDFNETSCSFLYHELTQKLSDSYLNIHPGMQSTFAGKIPFQRIDYILTDPSINVRFTKILHAPGSDHYPVVSTFSLP